MRQHGIGTQLLVHFAVYVARMLLLSGKKSGTLCHILKPTSLLPSENYVVAMQPVLFLTFQFLL